MARTVDEDELIEHWTLVGVELDLLAGKRGPTKLAFALLLKFHQQHGRFPRGRTDLSDEAVEFVAKAVKIPALDLAFYGVQPRYGQKPPSADLEWGFLLFRWVQSLCARLRPRP